VNAMPRVVRQAGAYRRQALAAPTRAMRRGQLSIRSMIVRSWRMCSVPTTHPSPWEPGDIVRGMRPAAVFNAAAELFVPGVAGA